MPYSPSNPRFCHSCHKAKKACLCSILQELATQTQIPPHFWVHPKEPSRARNTSWLAHKMLPDSQYHIHAKEASLPGKVALLFPGGDSQPWDQTNFDEIMVIDGTWDECKKMISESPYLQSLPKVSLKSSYLGKYQVRKPPFENALCTAEALGYLYLEMGSAQGKNLITLVEQLNQREIDLQS